MAGSPEDGDREERHGQERRREAEDGQVGSGPMQAEAFAEPERPETADQDADRELQRVLRDAGQRPAERQRGERHHDGGPDGSHARRDDHVAGGANREDDEDDLEPLEDHGLEGGDERDGIPAG